MAILSTNKKKLSIFSIIIFILTISEMIASSQIYISNKNLLEKIKTIQVNNEFITPSYKILPLLESFKESLYGGLFLVFTAGLCFGFAGFFSAVLAKKTKYKKTLLLISIIIVILATYNLHFKLVIWITLPLSVFLLTFFKYNKNIKFNIHAVITAFVILASILTFRGDSFFLDFRDKVLMTSSFGKSINNFYYRFTLPPAEVIKPLKQKALKTFNCNNINLKKKIYPLMKKFNYYPSDNINLSDLIISKNKKKIIFSDPKTSTISKVISTSKKLSYQNISKILSNFSDKNDHASFFRKITLAGLVFVFPLSLFFISYSLLLKLLSFFLKPSFSEKATSLILLLLFLFLMKPLFLHNDINRNNYLKYINISKNRFLQRDALKFAYEKKIRINDIIIKNNFLNTDYIPLAYWSILSFRIQNRQDLTIIAKKLNDKSVNIRYKAYEKLGKAPYWLKKEATELIKNHYPYIKNWYVQLYAFNALKKLL